MYGVQAVHVFSFILSKKHFFFSCCNILTCNLFKFCTCPVHFAPLLTHLHREKKTNYSFTFYTTGGAGSWLSLAVTCLLLSKGSKKKRKKKKKFDSSCLSSCKRVSRSSCAVKQVGGAAHAQRRAAFTYPSLKSELLTTNE